MRTRWGNMLAAERRARITELVQSNGAVGVAELMSRFDVSAMTVRRDLNELSTEGSVKKVHGGAVSPGDRRTEEPGFDAKSSQMESAKAAVADAASFLVEPGMSVALSAGTTTWALARRLDEVDDLTVVTNSIHISNHFHQYSREDRTVILTGGMRTRSDALVGPTAVSALRSIHVDFAFLGAHGVSAQAGCTTPNFLQAETNRALAAAAQRTSVICDHTKWGLVGVMTFAELDEVDSLIMDDGLEPEAVRLLQEQVQDLYLAPLTSAESD